MWKIVQELIPFFLIIILITQVIVPLFTNSKMFWLFRKKNTSKESLNEEFEEAKKVADVAKEKVNNVKEKANNNLKTAKDLKDEADNLI